MKEFPNKNQTSDNPNRQDIKPLVGMSSCLIGLKVRYDGRDKFHPELNKWLQKYFQVCDFCPEVAIGLGVPREPIHLVTSYNSKDIKKLGAETTPRSDNSCEEDTIVHEANFDHNYEIKLVEVNNMATHSDLKLKMQNAAESFLKKNSKLCGFVFKSKSPSCGAHVPVFNYKTKKETDIMSAGIFYEYLSQKVPCIEDKDFSDPKKRNEFKKNVHRYFKDIKKIVLQKTQTT